MEPIRGNAILEKKDIDLLRKGILEKYNLINETTYNQDEKIFNSSLQNYGSILESINNYISKSKYSEIGDLTSASALAVIFHHSKTSENKFEIIRAHAVNAFYIYAFDMLEEEYKMLNDESSSEQKEIEDAFESVEGLWFLYWDRRGDFASRIENRSNAMLNIVAIHISKDTTARYRTEKNHGSGKVEINDMRMTLKLHSEIDNKPLFIMLQTGTKISKNSKPTYLAGVYVNVDSVSNVKAGRVAMVKQKDLEFTSVDSNEFIEYFKDGKTELLFRQDMPFEYNGIEDRLEHFFTLTHKVTLSNNKMSVHLSHLLH